MINGFKEAVKEDQEQKREIQFLKKIDQLENLHRTQNFYVTHCLLNNYRICTNKN